MPIRYAHRRLSPAEFSRLLNDADFSVDDFIYLTGRRREQLERFLTGERKNDYVPTMAEVLLLELAKELGRVTWGVDDNSVVKTMFDIVRRGYDAGPPPKRKARAGQCKDWPSCECGRGGPDNCFPKKGATK